MDPISLAFGAFLTWLATAEKDRDRSARAILRKWDRWISASPDRVTKRMPFPPELREAMTQLHGGKCAYDDRSCSGKVEVDHIYPLKKGGNNYAKNLQFACRSHNGGKGATLPLDHDPDRKRGARQHPFLRA